MALCVATVACAVKAPVMGEQVLRHPNGEVRFAADTADGLPNGHGARYYDNGQLEYSGNFRNGDKSGLFHFYDREGNWVRQELFDANVSLWRSSVEADKPPATLLEAVLNKDDGDEAHQELPRPMFVAMDLPSRGGIARVTFQQFEPDAGPESSLVRALITQLSAAIPVARDDYGADYEVYGGISFPSVQNEVGRRMGKRTVELGASRTSFGGLSVATGLAVPVGGDTGQGYVAGVEASQLARGASDLYPRTLGLRSKAAHTWLSGHWVYRMDGGLDMFVDAGGDDDLATLNTPVVVPRLAALAGRRTERFFLSGQLHWQRPLNDGVNQSIANASLSAEILQSRLRPGASIYVPLVGPHTAVGVGFFMSYALD